MSNVIVIGNDESLTSLLTGEISAQEPIRSCRVVGSVEELEEVTHDAADAFVLVPSEARGFPDVEAAARTAAALRRGAHLILVSSAAVNEPNAHHPGLATEDALPEPRRRNALTLRWRELEGRVAQALEGSEAVLTVLRPAALVVDGSQRLWSRYFRGRIACTVMGFDPTVQWLSGEALAAAVFQVIDARAGGIYNVAPAGAAPLRRALSATRMLRLPLPYWVLRLWYGISGAPPEMLDYLRYSWTVSGEKLRQLGFQPSSPSEPYDDFGLDLGYIRRLGKVFFRFLHDVWWRVEWRGLDNVPLEGAAVLTGVHRGHQPWDGVMAMYHLMRKIGRVPRFLVHPALLKFPFLAPYMIRCGGVPACRENASWVLERGEVLGIFPEGIRGAFRMYRDVYKLGRFGRDEFVKMALRHQAPIVPFVTVGSAEIFPIFGRIKWSWWKRYSEWPFFPVTPTMSTVPLPSKWHTRILEPIHVEREYPPEAAEDRAVVRALSQEVRRRMEVAIAEMLERRKSIFFGSIFSEEEQG